jgi:hypothetical protein
VLSEINIVESATSSDVTLLIVEVDFPNEDYVGQYSIESDPPFLSFNKPKLTNKTFAEIQNLATHELGHALSLHHSYLGNVMYYKNSTQTTLGTQDILDYNYCWVFGGYDCSHY